MLKRCLFGSPTQIHRPITRAAVGKRILPESQRPFKFCGLCGTGGLITCPRCDGEGKITTKPGGAGVKHAIGIARCKQCNGLGRIPCALCAGFEEKLPPPQPFRPAHEADGSNDDNWDSP